MAIKRMGSEGQETRKTQRLVWSSWVGGSAIYWDREVEGR